MAFEFHLSCKIFLILYNLDLFIQSSISNFRFNLLKIDFILFILQELSVFKKIFKREKSVLVEYLQVKELNLD